MTPYSRLNEKLGGAMPVLVLIELRILAYSLPQLFITINPDAKILTVAILPATAPSAQTA